MIRKALLGFAIAAVLVAAGGAAIASDMPLKAPVASAQSSGMYLWTDGSYQSVKLPTYNLGVQIFPAPGTAGQAASFDQRLPGYGISGGVGFILPNGAFLSNFGRNARIEFGGSYVNAKLSPSASLASGGVGTVPHLDGTTPISSGCGAGCISTSNLSNSFSSWQASGRFLTDIQANGITWTPSLKVFGGRSRNEQGLSDRMSFVGSASFAQYDATTTLNWTDWGARLGLSGAVPLTDRLTFGAGGNVGLAARRVSLSGSDSSYVSVIPGVLNVSSISTSRSATPFLVNAETSLVFKMAPGWSLRTFAGLDYDSKVPGVLAPIAVSGGGTGTPAGIKYEAATSYYAGGGLTVQF